MEELRFDYRYGLLPPIETNEALAALHEYARGFEREYNGPMRSELGLATEQAPFSTRALSCSS